MTIQVPLIVVLLVAAWLAVKFLRIRWWAVAVLLLLGFYLNHTFAAPAIDQTTRTGVNAVNSGH